MARVAHWETRLSDWAVQAAHRPFSWKDQADCCLTACDAIRAITGVDPAAWFRGKYKTRTGAYGCLKRFAGGGLVETVEKITQENNWPEIPVLTARRGDVGIIPTDDGEALAICLGARWAAQGADGLVYVPLKTGLRAWRI